MRGPGTWLAIAILVIVLAGLFFFQLRENLDARQGKGPDGR